HRYVCLSGDPSRCAAGAGHDRDDLRLESGDADASGAPSIADPRTGGAQSTAHRRNIEGRRVLSRLGESRDPHTRHLHAPTDGRPALTPGFGRGNSLMTGRYTAIIMCKYSRHSGPVVTQGVMDFLERKFKQMDGPTWLVAAAIYASWFLLIWYAVRLPWWFIVPVGAYLIAWQFSLQHEAIHAFRGVPAWLRFAVVFPPLGLW